jgi:cGMP-dependent protein kinase
MHINSYDEGECVISRGTPRGIAIWIVVRGSVIYGERVIDTFTTIDDENVDKKPYGNFGEPVVANCETDIAKISREDFEQAIGGNFEDIA